MADEEYSVYADIALRTTGAASAAKRVGDQVQTLGARLRTVDSAAAKVTRNLLAIGGAYVGISAVSRAFSSMAKGAFKFEDSMQRTQLGLQSIVSSVEGMSFEQAGRQVDGIWKKLTKISIKTTATTQQVNEIFSGIYGPIRNAGASMETIYKMTSDSVHAANALGVDLQQATRDMMMMAQGAAGMDVKLFRAMRSTGVIKENTEAWNALAPEERVTKLSKALAKFAGAGDAAAKTLGGRISTFEDTYEQLRRAFAAPIFAQIANQIGELNDYLERNSGKLMTYLDILGYRVGLRLEKVFSRMREGLVWVVNNWDTIVARLETAVARVKEMAPALAKGAALYAAAGPAANLGGLGIQAAGGLTSMLGLGLGGGGAAAAGAAGGGAGAAAAAGGAAAVAPVAAALGIFASIGAAIHDQWFELKILFYRMRPELDKVWDGLKRLGMSLGSVLYDALRTVGNVVLMVLVPAFEGLVVVLEWVLPWLNKIAEGWKLIFHYLGEAMSWLTSKVLGLVSATHDKGRTLEWSGEKKYEQMNTRRGQYTVMPAATPELGARQRPTVNMDFRGSKFTIRQEFKDSEPDRVLRIFRHDLQKQAERRVQSNFAPAFTR